MCRIARCWRQHIITKKPDIFHKTMLRCIEASPKLNEIIACGRYCYRDLRKWPKLNKIWLIYELNMDEQKMLDSCIKLGETHAGYARFGMKPHFLDIYQQQFLGNYKYFKGFNRYKDKNENVQNYRKHGWKINEIRFWEIIYLKKVNLKFFKKSKYSKEKILKKLFIKGLIACIEFESSKERKETVVAFSRLCSFIINAFINAYAIKRSELKEQERAINNNT
ncbi:unnamed protein product [Meloidogyne enterolobii]|uniref:Uncharacterized protein n=1 Tax=Meloidogyne enterolobii TaxID=390850 RepID=A0ACB0ZSM8_MELEN